MKVSNHQPQASEFQLTSILQALSDPVRLEIISQLARRGEVACGCFDLEAPKSSLSHHFRVLRESGVVHTRREGKELLNSLRKTELESRFPGLLESILQALLQPG